MIHGLWHLIAGVLKYHKRGFRVQALGFRDPFMELVGTCRVGTLT